VVFSLPLLLEALRGAIVVLSKLRRAIDLIECKGAWLLVYMFLELRRFEGCG
jgi:hypothetical protein